MNRFFIAALGAALIVPVAALAQPAPPVAPPPPMAAPPGADWQQMMQLHQQERAKVLAALTPEHRTLLANLVGQLAISPTPDVDGAAAKLNAALSPGEKDAIGKIHDETRAAMQASMQGHAGARGGRAAPDLGHMLLMMAIPIGPRSVRPAPGS
ncbi:MAG: hypothetical protein JO359_07540 [Candidatus Eremiobacteraeota bacterium]|nr:hypothetical protein [Candidatus Eremiobacteraeota bacterium]